MTGVRNTFTSGQGIWVSPAALVFDNEAWVRPLALDKDGGFTCDTPGQRDTKADILAIPNGNEFDAHSITDVDTYAARESGIIPETRDCITIEDLATDGIAFGDKNGGYSGLWTNPSGELLAITSKSKSVDDLELLLQPISD